MRTILLLLLATLMIGCCGTRKTIVSENTTVKDSTVVKLTPVDTTIITPGESLKIVKPVSEISQEPIIQKGERTTLSVSVIDGVLTAHCEAEALRNKIRLMQKQIDRYREELTLKKDTITVRERYVPWYYKTLAFIGGIWLLVFLIRQGINLYKPKLI